MLCADERGYIKIFLIITHTGTVKKLKAVSDIFRSICRFVIVFNCCADLTVA